MSLAGNLDLDDVRAVEQIALRAWPGLEVQEHGGWLLRYARGITRRANSVWPNILTGIGDLDVTLEGVEAFYHARNLPARFQICPAALPAHLDELLDQRGYHAVARTAVQTTSLAELLSSLVPTDDFRVEMMPQPSSQWWACYAKADEVPPESVAVRQAICGAINVGTAFAMIVRDGEAIAVGSAALESSWIGFFNVATLAEHRRRSGEGDNGRTCRVGTRTGSVSRLFAGDG